MKFSKKQYDFLEKEFGLSEKDCDAMTEDELLELSDRCFDIELEGDLMSGSKMPDRCGMAASIVDTINASI